MAGFIINAITDRGRILLGDAQVGATLEATRIVMGSGHIPSGSTAASMTDVVSPVIELEINKKKRAGDGTVTFGGAFSNETITEAFYLREFALFARVQYADGTYSDEVLYSYGNAGSNADLIPAYSSSTVVEKQMDLVVWVGNETEVNLTVASGLYNAHAEKHAADGEDPLTPSAIGAIAESDITRPKYMGYDFVNDLNKFAGYRSGTFTSATTANVPDPIHPFYDVWNSSGSGRFYTQFASVVNDNITYFRKYYDGSFTEWNRLATLDFAGDFRLQKAKNGSAHFFKNHTSTVDYGSEIRDISASGNVAGFSMNATQQKVHAKFTENGQTTLHEIYHTGNAPAVVATAELV